MGSDDDTPAINRNRTAELWDMHPELSKVGSVPKIPAANEVPLVGSTGKNQRVLEELLSAVRDTLAESRLIRLSGQDTARHALKVFERIPALEKRMTRVEMIALGATLVNIAILLAVSCVR
jgi:hypothetical protein